MVKEFSSNRRYWGGGWGSGETVGESKIPNLRRIVKRRWGEKTGRRKGKEKVKD